MIKEELILGKKEDNFITKVKVKKVKPNAKLPTQGTTEAAGHDLYACIDFPVVIQPHQTAAIGTGYAIELPKNTFGALCARSGLSIREGLRPANCIGIIDSDYRGEIIMAAHNDSNVPRKIEPQDRIAQLLIIPYVPYSLEETDTLDNTERGEGGFGSTGMK